MNTKNQSEPKNELATVDSIINKIKRKIAGGDYIFRGESQHYEKVPSNLYRKLEKTGLLELDVETVQKEELRDAKKYGYTQKTDDFEILTEIQHFGGKTNLLDFTTDYRIALFFACNSFPFTDGRVILQDRNRAIKDWIIEPCDPDPKSRVRVQKSVFVRPPEGFIEPHGDDIVTIPTNLKQPMLNHLREDHCISAETIYPDLHGFVSSQDTRWDVYEEIGKGIDYLKSGKEAENLRKKSKYCQKAVQHFTNAIDNATQIQLAQAIVEAYTGRGCAYFAEYELDNSAANLENAIVDFSQAIELIQEVANANSSRSIELIQRFAEAYNRRGGAYLSKGDSKNAIVDLNKAIELKPGFAEAYHNRGVAYFIKREFILAIRDYTEAVQLKSDDSVIYYDRGIAWLHLQEWEKAKVDLIVARRMGFDIIFAFQDFYKNVGKYEQLIGAKLPSDIASLLTQM
ncbi:hypothetical protein C6503_16465 [Candidatus Poribacteria bacterium]|nr:MAG: hypothetical protein C6503_16465 [Candidatus Poribacteria bacterium]